MLGWCAKWKTDKSVGMSWDCSRPTSVSDFRDAGIALEMLPEIDTLHFQKGSSYATLMVSPTNDGRAALVASYPPHTTGCPGIEKMLEGNATIRCVKVSGSDTGKDCSSMVPAALAVMRNVQHLDLFYFTRNHEDAILRMLRVFEAPGAGLTTLEMTRVEFTDEIARGVARLIAGGRLESLRVRDDVGSESIAHPLIEALRSTTSLRELWLEFRFEMNESASLLFDVLRTNATLTSVALYRFNDNLFPLMIDVFRDNHTLRRLRHTFPSPFRLWNLPVEAVEEAVRVVHQNYTVVELPKISPKVNAMEKCMAHNAHNHAMRDASLVKLLLASKLLSHQALMEHERQTIFTGLSASFRKRQIRME